MFEPKDIQKIASFIKDSAADQAYDILIKDGPKTFGKDFPLRKFISKLIEHYSEKEMYNKCAKLQRVEEIWVTNKLLSEFEITSDE
mgnify:CR=1 FL=1